LARPAAMTGAASLGMTGARRSRRCRSSCHVFTDHTVTVLARPAAMIGAASLGMTGARRSRRQPSTGQYRPKGRPTRTTTVLPLAGMTGALRCRSSCHVFTDHTATVLARPAAMTGAASLGMTGARRSRRCRSSRIVFTDHTVTVLARPAAMIGTASLGMTGARRSRRQSPHGSTGPRADRHARLPSYPSRA